MKFLILTTSMVLSFALVSQAQQNTSPKSTTPSANSKRAPQSTEDDIFKDSPCPQGAIKCEAELEQNRSAQVPEASIPAKTKKRK